MRYTHFACKDGQTIARCDCQEAQGQLVLKLLPLMAHTEEKVAMGAQHVAALLGVSAEEVASFVASGINFLPRDTFNFGAWSFAPTQN